LPFKDSLISRKGSKTSLKPVKLGPVNQLNIYFSVTLKLHCIRPTLGCIWYKHITSNFWHVSDGGPVKHRGLEINASLEGEEGTWESLERS